MEEYLHNMKTLRSQMNDVEDQAAKISVEEQTLITSIQTMEIDLNFAKSEIRRLKEETEVMLKAKGQLCSQILMNQKKIASVEADSSNLFQTLELIQQESVSVSAKLKARRENYMMVIEDLNAKFQEQQDWINSHKLGIQVQGDFREQTCKIEGAREGSYAVSHNQEYETNKEYKDLTNKLDSMKAKYEDIKLNKSSLVSDNRKVEQSIQECKSRADNFPPELRAMDMKTLKEEQQALLSDKAAETEFLQSLQHQIQQLKSISHIIKCECGEAYKVEIKESFGLSN